VVLKLRVDGEKEKGGVMSGVPWEGRFTKSHEAEEQDGLWGVRSPEGDVIIPFAYRRLRFHFGMTGMLPTCWIAEDPEGGFTVFDPEGQRFFEPVKKGEVPPGLGHPHLAMHLAKSPEQEAEYWEIDLTHFARKAEGLRAREAFGPLDLHAPSLAALAGRFGQNDEGLLKKLGIWEREVEILEAFEWAGRMYPAGTRGRIGRGSLAYLNGGLWNYAAELPVYDFVPGAPEKAYGFPFSKLRVVEKDAKVPPSK
jgi:hypothetical protein